MIAQACEANERNQNVGDRELLVHLLEQILKAVVVVASSILLDEFWHG